MLQEGTHTRVKRNYWWDLVPLLTRVNSLCSCGLESLTRYIGCGVLVGSRLDPDPGSGLLPVEVGRVRPSHNEGFVQTILVSTSLLQLRTSINTTRGRVSLLH